MVEIYSRNRIVISKSQFATWEEVIELAKRNVQYIDADNKEKTTQQNPPTAQ